ncbi:oxidoreductase [Halopseudomonas pachastrellae]|jgi:3-hydroxyisobutyrate dehydrogenase|uniref:Oxidoreductase n=1 Tax=Halopseudomonas pachastrellae TaxID=254161 RepID=A0A1S8DJI7_9GAMM|nr:NAD(P)-dependent oxidoreductase [Halopseudomonas pachastrellae]MAQ52664.1 NAD(P)-dependent oxidoreductase [Pseudomonas sp.]MBB51759.1 NAD(P)-dependent oxidoreductase [Pseudomonadales bacterium]MBU31962.1 NAD(P)-dependent oxidoreductase [Pseudomonadales bacterium]ONM45555.1 oxidoreductase [Halopseudomonas pachastrellae]SFM36369.1 3-hydroxyisobutyrate dehydrogenase [Halopseudomonas pachastrellae]|tara:strand:+ start:3382 stop:4254 length:873 start_codon:yes stop_codon:yes gene_type:complete
MANVAFIGLGVMGYPMAGHLQRAGHQVTVYNRTAAKAASWVESYGGQSAATPAEAARGQDVVLLCVGNDDDLREVVCGEQGVLAGAHNGMVLVDHTTASAGVARELSALAAEQGVGFMDAPVSGGQAGAENGQLTIMAGGDEAVFDLVRPILSSYSRMLRLMGPVGSGQLTKMVNQICIGGLLQGLSEAMHFAQQAGLDGDAVVSVISKGAAQSWQMENRYRSMLDGEFDFGFAVDWMRKDLSIVLEEAGRNGARLPVTALVDQFYADVQAMGGGRWDTSSLIARLQRDS